MVHAQISTSGHDGVTGTGSVLVSKLRNCAKFTNPTLGGRRIKAGLPEKKETNSMAPVIAGFLPGAQSRMQSTEEDLLHRVAVFLS